MFHVDTMSLNNKYLKETPLTSTKNTFLKEDVCSFCLEEFELEWTKRNNIHGRKLKRLLSPDKSITEKFLVHQDYSLPKKKKAKKFRSVERCMGIPDYLEPESDVDGICIDETSFLQHPAMEKSTAMNFSFYGQPCGDGYLPVAKPSGFATFGNVPAPVAKPSGFSTFGNVPALPGSGVLFGSAASALPSSGGVFGSAASETSVFEKNILKMPTYELDVINLHEETEYGNFSSDPDDSNCLWENSFANLKGIKMQLLNVVSMALMYSSNLKDKNDTYRIFLQKSADAVRLFDPEFILKVALYARQELHIRTVSYFLLSYAALHKNTRIYLEKYFNASIVLPTDWIQVAEFYEVLSYESQKQPFPSALRQIMKKTFEKFDKYQLAKYNKNRVKKKENKMKLGSAEKNISEEEEDDDNEKNKIDDCKENQEKKCVKKLTLKQLIRRLHINSPTEHVMCLLGKKYPKSHEEFKSCCLPGTWDPTKAGTRMKLPVPETWETQVSAKGNKSDVWESLIDDNKLPYMAMLRNLKNLFFSEISQKHHMKVINFLKNKKSVINSRQLPMQFFEAYKIINKIEKMLEGNDTMVENSNKHTPAWKKGVWQKTKDWINKVSVSTSEVSYTKNLLIEYKCAITKALEYSSLNNLYPIPGRTLVISQIDAKQVHSAKSYETCIMIGLMCLRACEDCKMNILSCSKSPDLIFFDEDDQFLDVLVETCERYNKLFSDLNEFDDEDSYIQNSALQNVLDYYLKPHAVLSLKLDHIVFLQTSSGFENVMSSFLHKYRQIVNSDLLYTNVNFTLSSNSFSSNNLSDKDVYLCGSSSSLIKFIAERSSGGQLTYAENIDTKYNLKDVDLKKIDNELYNVLHKVQPVDVHDIDTPGPLNCKVPKWHTIRIFISSTFKDMISERDLFIRYVFPELKRRAASVFIRIVEIDLRWGITESDSSTKRAAEICLTEAQKADLFIGVIGDKYGTIYNFEPPDASDLQWVRDCPTGLSITELEIYAAALRNPELSQKKCLFYFRDNSFSRNIPKKWADHFASENLESKLKVDVLKAKIRSCNFKILDGYPCHLAGIFESKPILGGLDVLGNRVVEDIWNAVQDIHETDPYCDSVSEEDMYQQSLLNSQNFCIETKNSPLENVLHQIKTNQGIFVVYGAPGSGKTTFTINLLECLKVQIVIKFFIGVSPQSRDLSYMAHYLWKSICYQLGILIPLPYLASDIVNQFPDFLLEIANCCGGRDLVLLIDGLDHLENNDQWLDWLPLVLPNKVKLVCTVSESSQAFKVLCERKELGNVIFIQELPKLLQSDREQFVRKYLSYYRKTLEETAFNNHMLKIVTKKDSCNPLYLRIVCDFLRIYASFDNLVSMLQKLPSSTVLLFQEIILQMENEFGSSLIQTVLTLLCITKEGLEDNDLYCILSFFLHLNEMKTSLPFDDLKKRLSLLEPENFLCQVKYCSLMYVISMFAYGQLRQTSFSLVGTEFENAVKKFYINKNYFSHCESLHAVLSAYYYNMCDVKKNGQFCGQSCFSFRCVLYHMYHGRLYKELSYLLCNHKFIEAVFRNNAANELIEYYSSIIYDVIPAKPKLAHEIEVFNLSSFYDFVSRNFHIFHQYPQLVMQQALNEPPGSKVNLKNGCNYNFLENLSRSDIQDYRIATIGFVKNITASAGEVDKPIVILGSEDGYLKVLDISTRKVVRSIKANASAITCICFVGKNRICASSMDATLSLWNADDFTRIAVLSGHRLNVTSCCSDPFGSILFSAGWDNSVRLWSLSDGRSISVIDDFRCPLNCIDHHPVKQEIACGLWNGNIEIWDTVSMHKRLVFTDSFGSVKSLAYTQDGVNIISSFIQLGISIWSSEEGLKISCLKGHILPVKSLTYSFDDGIFVSGSDDCTLKVWSTSHESFFCTVSESKFCPVCLMEFMTENLLAVTFQNSEIWIIDINNGNIMNKTTLSSDTVSAFSKYSYINLVYENFGNNWWEKSLVFGTQSGKLMINDYLSSSIIKKTEMNSKITAINHNCDLIFCGTAEGDIGFFSHPDNKLSKIVYAAHKSFISCFCLSIQCGKLLALSTANDNVLKLWSIEWNNLDVVLQKEFFNKHKDGVTCSLFYPESCDTNVLDNLLTGSHDNNIFSWNENAAKVFHGLQSSVVNIACSGSYILGCGNDGALVMWSRNGSVLTTIPGIELSSATLTFYATKDESDKFTVILAFVDQDGSIKIKKPLQKTYCCSLDSHHKPITSCCTAANGEVISCSLDGCVSLWNIVHPNISSAHLMHSSIITGTSLSLSLEFAVSSDAHGNLILWKTHLNTLAAPLTYAGKKSYNGGFIKAISWLKGNCLVCAVSQVIESQEEFFLNIIQLNCNSVTQLAVFNLEVKKSYNFESEVLCLDSCSSTDTIIVGLKSGHVMIITPKLQRLVKVVEDWLLGVRLFTSEKTSDFLCASFIDGTVTLYPIANFLNLKETTFCPHKLTDTYKDWRFTSSMCCGNDKLIYCGDSEGILRIYSKHSLKFTKKVHNDSISGICIVGAYLFTSSLDKTVKGWNLKSLKQVYQFHSHTSISCLSSPQTGVDLSNSNSHVLLIGTISGKVYLLKFHYK